MKVTRADLAFWQLKTEPQWARNIRKSTLVNIHSCINSHAPKEHRDKDFVAHNLLVILRLQRKRGEMLEGLEEMSKYPGCAIRPERRSAYCRKWFKKILSNVPSRLCSK